MPDEIQIVKQYDPESEPKSIVAAPPVSESRRPSVHPYVIHVATAAQSITAWGVDPVKRDKQLRSFWHSESWLASVVYSVTIRNASFVWAVEGSDPNKPRPKNTIDKITRMLKLSNRGRGWKDLIIKTCIDLYSQDNAAFWEIIRKADSPDAPVVNIAHLDSGRCQRTGDPRSPVIYRDRFGREHILRWYQVRTIEEFPAPQEEAYSLQYSAVSRALMAAEIIQSIAVYKLEKVGGTFTRAIDAISGLTQNNIDDAIAMAEEQNLNKGLRRYSLPVIMAGVDPTTSLSHVHIDLASLPDNFDEDISFKWYVAQLASAFGVDYQEIAPLMTGNLGASQQSEILHLKTRGKGPALMMGLFEDIINQFIPSNVQFKFLEQDLRSETEKAEARFTRSKDRSMRVKSGELTPDAARKIAVEDGDLPLWLAEEIERAAPEDFNETRPDDEFSADQVESGQETQETKKLTRQQIKLLAHKISAHRRLEDALVKNKASIGFPDGTFILPVFSIEKLGLIRADLMEEFATTRARFVPEDSYHITLAYCGLLDDIEAQAVAKRTSRFEPMMITVSRLGSFSTPNSTAIVALVDKTPQLLEMQQLIYDNLVKMGATLSEYSKPEQWTPHITLAYVEGEFTDRLITPVYLQTDIPVLSRSAYDIVWGEPRAIAGY